MVAFQGEHISGAEWRPASYEWVTHREWHLLQLLAADTGLEICKFDRILYSLCRLQVHVLLQSAYVDLDLSPNSCKNQNHPQLDPNLWTQTHKLQSYQQHTVWVEKPLNFPQFWNSISKSDQNPIFFPLATLERLFFFRNNLCKNQIKKEKRKKKKNKHNHHHE